MVSLKDATKVLFHSFAKAVTIDGVGSLVIGVTLAALGLMPLANIANYAMWSMISAFPSYLLRSAVKLFTKHNDVNGNSVYNSPASQSMSWLAYSAAGLMKYVIKGSPGELGAGNNLAYEVVSENNLDNTNSKIVASAAVIEGVESFAASIIYPKKMMFGIVGDTLFGGAAGAAVGYIAAKLYVGENASHIKFVDRLADKAADNITAIVNRANAIGGAAAAVAR
jgi:hypothetical protein